MSWWEWFQTGPGAITVVGVILGVVTWLQNRATNRLMAQGDAKTQDILASMDQHWREAWERMDQRADERQREVVQAIQALRG